MCNFCQWQSFMPKYGKLENLPVSVWNFGQWPSSQVERQGQWASCSVVRGTTVSCVSILLYLCIFSRIMSCSGPDTDLDVHDVETTPPSLRQVPIIKPTLPVAEFGCGISDSTYRPHAWSGMAKLFQQETLSDVMLMAEGQSIPCHKFLLAAASDYFYNKLVVDAEAVNGGLLEIEGISFTTLKAIARYLYTGDINITAENTWDLIPACKMMNLTSACDTCETFALGTVNTGNCIGLFKMASKHNLRDLSAKALEVMVSDFTEVVSGGEFFNMPENEVVDYIQNENLKIPNEDPVFEAVISWVKHQSQERESSFNRLITHVRLRYCSPHYLSEFINKELMMENLQCQKSLMAALVQHTAAAFPDSNKQPGAAPRTGYPRKTTLITIGGFSDPGPVRRTECWRLEEVGWRVMKQCPMPAPALAFFSACVTKEGILVTGGFRDAKKPVSQCWSLSTSTYRWSPLPNLNTARARHASVCVGGQPYVIAGEGCYGTGMSSVECLQKVSGKWDSLPDLPKCTKGLIHPMVVSHGQCIYVFGGINMEWNPSRSVFVYDTCKKPYEALADMPQTCTVGFAVVWKDRIYIVGGFERSCMRYDPALAQWSTLSQCRHEHDEGPALVWKDRILVCGGMNWKAKRDDGNPGGTSMIEEYDPETDTWTVSQIELPLKLSAHFVFNIETCY